MTTSERIGILEHGLAEMSGPDKVLLIEILDELERRIQNMESAQQTTNVRLSRIQYGNEYPLD